MEVLTLLLESCAAGAVWVRVTRQWYVSAEGWPHALAWRDVQLQTGRFQVSYTMPGRLCKRPASLFCIIEAAALLMPGTEPLVD